MLWNNYCKMLDKSLEASSSAHLYTSCSLKKRNASLYNLCYRLRSKPNELFILITMYEYLHFVYGIINPPYLTPALIEL